MKHGAAIVGIPSEPRFGSGNMNEFEFQPGPFEAYSEGEDFEAFDAEVADGEWEDELRRFGRMPGRVARPRMRSAPRRRPPQSRTRPPLRRPRPLKRPIPRPQRPPRGRPQPGGRGGLPFDSSQEPVGTEPQEPAGAEPIERGSEYVRWVQSSLNQVLGLRLPITGVMNAAVRSALRTFQGQ